MKTECELIIVGAGPAGVTAATKAHSLGINTLLIDEQPNLGGNVYRNIENVSKQRPGDFAALDKGYQLGEEVMGAYAGTAENTLHDAQVWHIDHKGLVGILKDGKASFISAKRVLIACGAMERPVPIPGWTLPGVMTVGASQTLLKASGLIPNVATILAGSGPLVVLLAHQLASLGTPVKAVVMTSPFANYMAAAREALSVLNHPGPVLKGLAWLVDIYRKGIPIYSGAHSLAVQGDERASSLEFKKDNRTYCLDAELVLLHEGIVPNTYLTMAGDCEHEWDEQQLCWRPRTNRWGQTSVEALYAVGDCAGILGTEAAPLSAKATILAIAVDLEKISAGERDRQGRPLHKAIEKEKGLRRFLDAVYRAPGQVRGDVANSTLICRCEHICAGEIREMIKLGCVGPNQAKSFTRCGMGPCQGRMCGLTVTEIFAKELNKRPEEVGYFRIRPPIKPITVEEFAGAADPDTNTFSTGMFIRADEEY